MKTADPVYRRLQRTFVAACMLAAPLTLASWFALCPQYGDPTCPSSVHTQAVFAAFRAASPGLVQMFLAVNLIVPYIYPISYVGLGLVPMKRSPCWSTAGIGLGWLGSIAWGFISDGIITLHTAIRLGQDASFALFRQAYFSDPRIYLVAIGWVIGHWGAYVLLGIAFWRARVIPRWAALVMILSGPLMGPVAYGTNIGILQVLGFLLVFLASIPAVIVMVARSHDARSEAAILPAS